MAEFIPTGLGGFTARPAVRKAIADKPSDERQFARQELMPPPRPRRNIVPDTMTMDALVKRALAALAKGIYWDRGSILNIVL